jgi:hypothetical protein
VLLFLGACGPRAMAQRTTEEEAGEDADPTRPILFSFRDEYSRLRNQAWQNLVILRADAAIFERLALPGRARGFLLRADVPFPVVHAGTSTQGGLGDAYGQVLILPSITPLFWLPFGTGVVLPTATSQQLGMGKLILAPAAIPVLLFPGHGFAFVKLQDWFSVAGGSDRPRVHYLTVTPTFLWRIRGGWWTLVDAETNTNWLLGGRTWAKAGFLLGKMFTPRYGLSLKAEVPFGAYRPGDWTLKVVVFVIR